MEGGLLKPGTYFMQGNEALAEGALFAGCKFFAGYPITPASEVLEYLAKKMPLIGGICIQMEDEMASLAAVIGASWAGAKAMTATSGPGFSLMQELIGYAFMTETPAVIADIQRQGPSTGQATKGAQGDVMQSRWGTHGDYMPIVLSPNSPQEMFELIIDAFNLAEEYRTPVILLADEAVAHMREKVEIPSRSEIKLVERKKPKSKDEPFFGGEDVPPMPPLGEGYWVAVTGSTHNEYGIRFTADPEVHRRLAERLIKKITKNADKIAKFEEFNIENCDVGIVTYGCTSRSIYETVELAKEKGVRVGFIRLKTIWPFPEKAVKKLAENAEILIVPEMNLKQLYYEVERVTCCKAKVFPLSKVGGGEMIAPEEILAEILRRLGK